MEDNENEKSADNNADQQIVESKEKTVSKKKSDRQKKYYAKKIFGLIPWFLVLVAFLFMLVVVIKSSQGKKSTFVKTSATFEEFKGNSPELVFESVDFYKYVIKGTADGTNGHFDKLEIFNVKGTAEFIFDLNKITYLKNKKNHIVTIDDSEYFPVSVKVNIDKNTKIDEIKPEPISQEEAKAAAKTVGVISGGVGSFLGGVAGAKVGALAGVILPFKGVGKIITRSISTGLGSVAVGATAGKVSYTMTNNFLCGRELTTSGFTLSEEEDLKDEIKTLIALELMTDNNVSNNSGLFALAKAEDVGMMDQWQDNSRHVYQVELEQTLRDFFKAIKVDNVMFKYTSGAKVLTDNDGKEIR